MSMPIIPRRRTFGLTLHALGALSGVVTAGLVTAACYESYRHRHCVTPNGIPAFPDFLSSLHATTRGLLATSGRSVPARTKPPRTK